MRTIREIRDFDSFFELVSYFDTEQKCVDYLAQLRWNGKPQCPYCEHDHAHELKGKNKRWKCAKCRKQFSVKIGTIFEESKLPLRKWFFAIYLVTAHKKGVSSHQLAKDLKITQKAAWFMLQRIRHAFAPATPILSNEVEVDETYMGGKEKNKHWDKKERGTQGRSTKTKTPVLGIIERNGKVYALPVKNTSSGTIIPIVNSVIKEGTKVYTDEYNAYRAIGRNFEHSIVKHSANEYVDGVVHTNNIESFWALLKRGYIGIYHHMSDKHLEKYVNEFTFRFNNRMMSEGSRFDILLANTNNKRLSYSELISENNEL